MLKTRLATMPKAKGQWNIPVLLGQVVGGYAGSSSSSCTITVGSGGEGIGDRHVGGGGTSLKNQIEASDGDDGGSTLEGDLTQYLEVEMWG
jgi:hypothetical protein